MRESCQTYNFDFITTTNFKVTLYHYVCISLGIYVKHNGKWRCIWHLLNSIYLFPLALIFLEAVSLVSVVTTFQFKCLQWNGHLMSNDVGFISKNWDNGYWWWKFSIRNWLLQIQKWQCRICLHEMLWNLLSNFREYGYIWKNNIPQAT